MNDMNKFGALSDVEHERKLHAVLNAGVWPAEYRPPLERICPSCGAKLTGRCDRCSTIKE